MPPIMNQPGQADFHSVNPPRTPAPVRTRNYRTFTVRALLVATTVTAVLVALWMAFQPKRYATAFLHVKSATESAPVSLRHDPIEISAFKAQQIELLHSNAVLAAALKEPGISQLSIVRGRSDPVSWLRANLETNYPNDSEILRVQLASSHPDEAVKVVNAAVNAYFDLCVYVDVRIRKQHREVLQRVYDERRQDAKLRRLELMEFATTADTAKTAERPADKPAGKPSEKDAEKDAELARREALVNEAFLELAQANLEADAPERVQMIATAEIQK